MNSFRTLPQNVPSAVSNRSGKLSRRTSFRGDSTTTPAAWLPATHAAALVPAASDFATDVVSWGRLSCAAFSMRGRTHTENEDAFYVAPEHGIFALADGVSGLKTGARASGLAVLTATEYLRRQLNGIEPQILSVGLLPGDRLLLCSDGVHGELADDSIQRLLVGAPAMAGWSLVKRVADLEGSDDATLVVIEKQ